MMKTKLGFYKVIHGPGRIPALTGQDASESNSPSFVITQATVPTSRWMSKNFPPFILFHSKDFYFYWFIAPELGALSDLEKDAILPASSPSVDSVASPHLRRGQPAIRHCRRPLPPLSIQRNVTGTNSVTLTTGFRIQAETALLVNS